MAAVGARIGHVRADALRAATPVVVAYGWVDQGASTPPFDIPAYHPSTRLEYHLATHRAEYAKGVNVYIVNDVSATSRQPADMSTVTRLVYGGHDLPDDLSSGEIGLLVTAGFIQQI